MTSDRIFLEDLRFYGHHGVTHEQQSVGALCTWTSDNEEVARLSDRPGDVGVVIAGASTGTATITATLPGGLSASALVKVEALPLLGTGKLDLREVKRVAAARLGESATVA